MMDRLIPTAQKVKDEGTWIAFCYIYKNSF